MAMKIKAMHSLWRCYKNEAHPPFPVSSLFICLFEPVPDLPSAQIFSDIDLLALVNYSLS